MTCAEIDVVETTCAETICTEIHVGGAEMPFSSSLIISFMPQIKRLIGHYWLSLIVPSLAFQNATLYRRGHDKVDIRPHQINTLVYGSTPVGSPSKIHFCHFSRKPISRALNRKRCKMDTSLQWVMYRKPPVGLIAENHPWAFGTIGCWLQIKI